MPERHAQVRGAQAGKEREFAAPLPLLNRERYVTGTGARMNDAEVAEFLGEAWKTIATGGANKIETGQFRDTGARANRGSDSRVINFRDGDAYHDSQKQCGERANYDGMTCHVQYEVKDDTARQDAKLDHENDHQAVID